MRARVKLLWGGLLTVAVVGIVAVSLVSSLGLTNNDEVSILEDGPNINRALQLAQAGRGPKIIGEPTAVYGKAIKYSEALDDVVGPKVQFGESQAWKLDRQVYLYLFEGEFTNTETGTSHVTDWEQALVIFDAETAEYFMGITTRTHARLDVSKFLPLRIQEDAKEVPPRGVSVDRPEPIAEPKATPAATYWFSMCGRPSRDSLNERPSNPLACRVRREGPAEDVANVLYPPTRAPVQLGHDRLPPAADRAGRQIAVLHPAEVLEDVKGCQIGEGLAEWIEVPEKESGFLVGELDGRVSAAFDAVIAEVIIEGFPVTSRLLLSVAQLYTGK